MYPEGIPLPESFGKTEYHPPDQTTDNPM